MGQEISARLFRIQDTSPLYPVYPADWQVEASPNPQEVAKLLTKMGKLVYLPSQEDLEAYKSKTGNQYYRPDQQLDDWMKRPPPENIFTVSYIEPEGKRRIEVPIVAVNDVDGFVDHIDRTGLSNGLIVAARHGSYGMLGINYNQINPEAIEFAERLYTSWVVTHQLFPQGEVEKEPVSILKRRPYLPSSKHGLITSVGRINSLLSMIEPDRFLPVGSLTIALHFKKGPTVVFSSARFTDFYPNPKQ